MKNSRLRELGKSKPAHAWPKSQKNVLVTSISKKMPLLRAVRAAMDKTSAYHVLHGSDMDDQCLGQYGVDEFFHSPPLSALSLNDILQYCRQNHIQAIIPTRDEDVYFFAQFKKALAQENICVMVSEPEAAANCLDKKRFADLLLSHGLPAIPTPLSLDELKAELYVVKERYGAGSAHIGLKLSLEGAKAHKKKLKHPIFQQFFQGQEWSVDLYRSKNGIVIGVVARRRDLVVAGESQVTTTAAYPDLEELCTKAAHILNIYGHAIFQVIEIHPGKFMIIECNPRFGGASTASIAVGLDSFYWFFMECLGAEIEKLSFSRSLHEVRQIRYPVDEVIPWSSSSI